MRRSSPLWRKANLIALLLTLIIGIATFAVGKRILSPVTARPIVTVGPAAPAQTTPKEVDVIVPEGMPLSFTAATEEDNEKGHEIKTSLNSKHTNKINSLTYLTYEFDPAGNLVRVEGGIKRVDLEARKSASLSILPQRRSNPKNRLMIALEKVTTDKDSWSASPLDLAIAGANKAKGKDQPISGKQDKEKIDEDFGSGLCINGYRRASQLAEAGEKSSPTSFTCDQTGRAYAFTFTGKALVK
jgi:hypothetical protein